MAFNSWIDTFLSEKAIDMEKIIEVEGNSGTNYIPVNIVVDAMKATSDDEKKAIKATFVKIDFNNGDVMHFITHLAKAIAL